MGVVADGSIVALDRIDARVEPHDWPYLREAAPTIARHWATISAGKPAMFDGRVLLQHRAAIEGRTFRAGYFETSYAAFLTWRDQGYPGEPLRNGFAMAALQAACGAFLLGRMSARTANAGQVYFAAGTPDPGDVRPDGTLDLAGSVTRELAEETGLEAGEYQVGQGWHAIILKGRLAFMRPVSLPWGADEARALILGRIARQEDPELDDIVVVRGLADCDGLAMPPFMRPYLAYREGRPPLEPVTDYA